MPVLLRNMPGRRWLGPVLHIGLVALSFTLLNAFKPLHADDNSYYTYAVEYSKHPLRPYGFFVANPPYSMRANQLLVPPVLPYWWAMGLRMLGDDPFFWKLWLLPFALLLSGSVYALLRRFASGVEAPLLWLMVLSPALLPGFNGMLDVPALGLGLSALAVAMRACDRRSWGLTVLAGLLLGLAAQTKYTALVPLAAVVLWSIQRGRARYGLAAAALALLLFVSWEAVVALQEGQSHFLVQLGQRQGGTIQRWLHLALPLVSLVGGLASAVVLLGGAGLGWSRRRVSAATAVVGLGFLGLALAPDSWAILLRDPRTHEPRFTLANALFGVMGLVAWAMTLTIAYRLRRAPWCAAEPPAPRIDRFLVGWLILETLGYFALSPFPAARRVVGILLVMMFLAARLASHTCRTPPRLALVRGVALAGVLLGLFVFTVDWWEARTDQQAAELASCKWKGKSGRTTWFLGFSGFAFYAERAGLKPLVFNESPLPEPGDLIVVPDDPLLSPELERHEGDRLELIDTLSLSDGLPLSTAPCYYSGRVPLEHHEGPRLVMRIYRVRGADPPAAP